MVSVLNNITSVAEYNKKYLGFGFLANRTFIKRAIKLWLVMYNKKIFF